MITLYIFRVSILEKEQKKIKELLNSNHFKHETKRHVLKRFVFFLSIVIAYFGITSYQYGLDNGIAVTIITWSFFVFCTPIADAGFLLDFPIRLLTRIRMIYSEVFVWGIATISNIIALTFFPNIYEKTILLILLKKILLTPLPFGLIILLSAIGTFMSIYFGDELLDKVNHSERVAYHKHKKKHKMIFIAFIISLVIMVYYWLISDLGINI